MNTYFTKNPIVGTPLTPSVIKQINTAVRRFMPIAGNGIRTTVTAGGTIISAIPAPASNKAQKTKPLPFEVRYDGTLDSGAGGWKVYLPTEHLVRFDGAYLDPLNDVTPILDENGDETGWYSFGKITLQDNHVWLVISESSSEGSDKHTASFANAEDQQAVANICIAEVSYEEATETKPETITIKQSVVGAIVMSSGGGVVPDDISTEFIPDPPHGQQPTGDEGKLQIKGFKSGQPADTNNLSDYLQGQANIPSGGIALVCRTVNTNQEREIIYLPLAALFSNSSIASNVSLDFIADIDWYVSGSTHQLRKRIRTLNLKTGETTDKAGTTYANGWEVAANTTAITSIPRS